MTTILAVNVGSSSLKTAVFEAIDGEPRETNRFNLDDVTTIQKALITANMPTPNYVGHRIVHGGEQFSTPVVVDGNVIEDLRRLIPLAPLHTPRAIAAIETCMKFFPNARHVASFDTAFHSTLPRVAYDLALPSDVASLGIRRYGFHGLNCEHVVDQHPDLGRCVIAHLGNGCSMTAIDKNISVDTTMAFTPNSGIPMGTRSGDLDPGILIYLLRNGYDIDDIDDIVQHRSGLSAWSLNGSNMQRLIESDSPDARFAIEAFCVHVAKAIASLSISLGSIDTLVFTGGIGENAEDVRERIVDLIGHLGSFETRVVSANEERILALHASAAGY